ncbi:hypothetical protein VNO77_20167 [Canavalia gladiata]|uniref:Tyrosinase copper-binding domain-containing protein n=1 Tax=Canavalia gladiata TaxID=3824 RepID=A0AAN9LP48_CANGL
MRGLNTGLGCLDNVPTIRPRHWLHACREVGPLLHVRTINYIQDASGSIKPVTRAMPFISGNPRRLQEAKLLHHYYHSEANYSRDLQEFVKRNAIVTINLPVVRIHIELLSFANRQPLILKPTQSIHGRRINSLFAIIIAAITFGYGSLQRAKLPSAATNACLLLFVDENPCEDLAHMTHSEECGFHLMVDTADLESFLIQEVIKKARLTCYGIGTRLALKPVKLNPSSCSLQISLPKLYNDLNYGDPVFFLCHHDEDKLEKTRLKLRMLLGGTQKMLPRS